MNAGWILVIGQKKVEADIISGMQFRAALLRLVFHIMLVFLINSLHLISYAVSLNVRRIMVSVREKRRKMIKDMVSFWT